VLSTEWVVPFFSLESFNKNTPVIHFVNKILLDAIEQGASDIHFEPYEENYRIRLRKDGILATLTTLPIHLASKFTARLKVLSHLDIAEQRLPQDGRFKIDFPSFTVDLRISTCPTLFGEKIVVRILDPTRVQLDMDMLGMENDQKIALLQAIHRPQGLILVTGPTGSGKTTSLYTALHLLNQGHLNISTVEDPIEIRLPGLNQVNIHPKIGLTFSSVLSAFLRQDPDVIMVGEIRDTETAEIAIRAAQTGHLVLSTLHTNSAPETLTRLIDMGIPAFHLATAVTLVIAQRLVRRLCEHCKVECALPPDTLLQIGFTEEEMASLTLLAPHITGLSFRESKDTPLNTIEFIAPIELIDCDRGKLIRILQTNEAEDKSEHTGEFEVIPLDPEKRKEAVNFLTARKLGKILYDPILLATSRLVTSRIDNKECFSDFIPCFLPGSRTSALPVDIFKPRPSVLFTKQERRENKIKNALPSEALNSFQSSRKVNKPF